MPIESDPYGGTGGGSTTSVCTISPSDNVAIVGNIINRVSDIERFLSRIVAADVYANNLSDLAENMGNLLNGTLMMPYSTNNSWAGVGGSVTVPDDFTGTFVSGGVTTIWNDGVVTFEATPHGIVTGGGPQSYLVCRPSTATLSSLHPDLSTTLFSFGTAFDTSDLAGGIIGITQEGYYRVSVALVVAWSAGTGNKSMTVQVAGTDAIAIDDADFLAAGDRSNSNVVKAHFGFEATVGNYIEITFSGVSGLDGTRYNKSIVTVEKVK